MTDTVFVPLEALRVDSETGSHGHLHLSRRWGWAQFPEMAWCLVRTLDARTGVQASDEVSHVWELTLEGQPYHLCWHSDGLALLEGRTPAARAQLPGVLERLQSWADETEEGDVGKRVPVPRGVTQSPQAPRFGAAGSRRHFIWTRGVLGLGFGAGMAWMLAFSLTGRGLPWPWMLLLGFGIFPAVGALWAAWLWKQGRA